jgi:hypothetical protein
MDIPEIGEGGDRWRDSGLCGDHRAGIGKLEMRLMPPYGWLVINRAFRGSNRRDLHPFAPGAAGGFWLRC